MRTFILASQSPRRQALVRLLPFTVEVQVADVDEESVNHPDPAVNVVQRARLKAEAVGATANDAIIIAADTTVALEGNMLGKPADADEAQAMLRLLRGRTHQVHTGIALLDTRREQVVTTVSTTEVTMRNYGDEELEKYVAGGDPLDKAGSYAIQHEEFQPVAYIEGCYTGVVGLPLCFLCNALQRLGMEITLPVAGRTHDYRHCQTCQTRLETKGIQL